VITLPPRNVWIISLAAASTYTGFYMFVPLFPIYVKGFGISVTELGIILASFAVARIIFQVPFGAISDRIGRKFLIVSALFAYSGIIVLYALSSNTYEFLVFRFLQGTASAAVSSSAMPLIIDSSPPQIRASSIGLYQTAVNVGLISGPVIGGVLASLYGLRSPFFLGSALALMAGIISIILLREPARISNDRPKTIGVRALMEIPRAFTGLPGLLKVTFVILAIANLSEYLGYGMFEPTFPLYASKQFGATSQLIGLTFSVGSIGLAVGPSFLGRLADRVGRKSVMVGGLATISFFVALYPVASDVIFLVLLMIHVSIGTSAFLTSLPTLVGEIAQSGRRAVTMAMVNVMGDIGLVLGPILAGAAWDRLGPSSPFFIDSVIVGLGALAVLVGVRETYQQKDAVGQLARKTDSSS